MKASLSIAVATLIAGIAWTSCARAQQVDVSAIETAPNTATEYAVEIYLDNHSVAITSGGVFDRYWSQSHGGVIKISDPSASEGIISALQKSPSQGGRIGDRELNGFLSEVNVVIETPDDVYFVRDRTMLRSGEFRLRETPACIQGIVASWPVVPGKTWSDPN